jgi:CTP synthase (UTP-ammonia lyase)
VPTKIAALGDRDTAYLTHREVDAAMRLAPADIEIRWLPTDGARIDAFDGVWVLPGTPYRDEGAVYAAIRFAREQGMPILGTCGGFQHMAVEFARNAAGIAGAGHAETDPDGESVVVGALACSLVGEERTVTAVPGTRLAALCGTEPFTGFHWCNYGLADGYADRLAAAGLVIGAHADDAGVEAFELPAHPFYLATLFQPQVGSSERDELHPVIAALVEASARRARAAPEAPARGSIPPIAPPRRARGAAPR